MKKKKITKVETSTVIDGDGEIKRQEQKETYLADQEPYYVKLYLKDMVRIHGLPPSSNKVLMALIASMGYNNMVVLISTNKKIMCKSLGIKMNTFNKCLVELKKEGIIQSIDRSCYFIDPEIVGRGKWEDIKALRTVITYSKEGRKISTERVRNQLEMNLNQTGTK